jgi:hypothetical protein
VRARATAVLLKVARRSRIPESPPIKTKLSNQPRAPYSALTGAAQVVAASALLKKALEVGDTSFVEKMLAAGLSGPARGV